MKFEIHDESFQNNKLSFETAGFWTGQKIYINGERLKLKKNKTLIKNDLGEEVQIELKPRLGGLDPVSDIELDGRKIELERKLEWHEVTWMGLPLLLITIGGALGAILGVVAVRINSSIFRSKRNAFLKYSISGLVSIGATFLMLVVVMLIKVYIK